MKRQFTIQIGGDKWKVKFVHRAPRVDKEPCDGVCDHGRKVISISLKQSEEEQRETLIHEWLHARFPELTEEVIELSGKQLAEAILEMD